MTSQGGGDHETTMHLEKLLIASRRRNAVDTLESWRSERTKLCCNAAQDVDEDTAIYLAARQTKRAVQVFVGIRYGCRIN